MFERFARQLIGSNGELCIDRGVLRALLKTPRFKHGVRSLEAILDMSMLAGRKCFDQTLLPSVEQLKLHVDAELFSRFVLRDILFGSSREKLAQAIHEQYLAEQKKGPSSDPALKEWKDLDEDFKESNRRQADHIPEKLRAINCGIRPMISEGSDSSGSFKFSDEEVELLAEMEHERWFVERQLAGWCLGVVKNKAEKKSPNMVLWSELKVENGKDPRDLDRNAVRNIPDLLRMANLEIYRLDC
jgi:hypothetical protein